MLIGAFSLPSLAERLPDQTDLTAAYCQGVLESRISGLEKFHQQLRGKMGGIPQSRIDELDREFAKSKDRLAVDLRRINLYLVPRLSQLSLNGLVAAKQSGKEDFERGLQEVAELNCVAECDRRTNEQFSVCMDTCNSRGSPAYKRVNRCVGASFLPM